MLVETTQQTVPTKKKCNRAMAESKVPKRASLDHNSDKTHKLGFVAPDADKAVCRRAPVTAFPRARLRERADSKPPEDFSENVQPLSKTTEPVTSETRAAAAFHCSVLPRGPSATFGTAPRPCAHTARQKTEDKLSEHVLLPSRSIGASPENHPASIDRPDQKGHSTLASNSNCAHQASDAKANPSRSGSPGTEDGAGARDGHSRYSDTIVKSLETCEPVPQQHPRAPTVDARTTTAHAAHVAPNPPATTLLPRHGSAVFGSAPRWKASSEKPALHGAPPHDSLETRPVASKMKAKQEAPVPTGAQVESIRRVDWCVFPSTQLHLPAASS